MEQVSSIQQQVDMLAVNLKDSTATLAEASQNRAKLGLLLKAVRYRRHLPHGPSLTHHPQPRSS